MAKIEALFATRIYQARLPGLAALRLNKDLRKAALSIAEEDRAGQAWSRAHGYGGYTTYASLTDLLDRAPVFQELKGHLDQHALAFARALTFDLGRKRLELDSLWINVLRPGGVHTGHIHPHSALSGTYYVSIPKGASAIRFEDPRLGLMMAAPPRRARTRREHQLFVTIEPEAGTLLMWESWLRHEVPLNRAAANRISLSFNYRWA